MESALSKRVGSALIPWFGVALIVVFCDRLSKITIMNILSYGEERMLTSFFNLVLVYNRGAAFSFLASANGWQRWVFTVFGVMVALVIVYLLRRYALQQLFCMALALILGGAIGNVIDRLIYGHVLDFLDFHLSTWHWPAFNLADSAITIGALLLLFDKLRCDRPSR